MNIWKIRWSKVHLELVRTREENVRLRAALDEINTEYDDMFNQSGQGDIEAAKTWLIGQQRKTIKRLRAAVLGPVNTTP